MTREEAVALLERYSNYDGMGIPNLAGCKEAMKVAVDALKEAFPELAESEDERIRRELMEFVNWAASRGSVRNDWLLKKCPEKWIAYLEKQKECVSNIFDDVWAEEDCEEIIAEGQKLTPRFKELLKEVCHAWYDRGAKFEKQKEHLRDFMKKMEQKPAEWSEEDDAYRIEAVKLLENPSLYESCPGLRQETIEWLKQLPKVSVNSEWSVEDEDRIRQIERIAQKAGCTEKLQEEIHDWLKSLRQQPSWKPSEEQMEAFKKYIEEFQARAKAAVGGWNNFDVMIQLYEQLKKL